MAGNVKLMTSAGGGVVLDTATTTATDVTVKVPVTGVDGGTLVCSNSSGNVGIGTSSPSQRLQVQSTASNTRTKIISELSGSYYYSGLEFARSGVSGGALIETVRNPSVGGVGFGFYTTADNTAEVSGTYTERMRIDSSGNLLVGTTSSSISLTNGFNVVNTSSDTRANIGHASGTASGTEFMRFSYNGTGIGAISQNGTTNVTYATSSDYRLKENIQPMQNALGVVQQLNPVTYTWKADGSDGQGFIAHELQAVVPDCVTGEKDAVDEQGNPVYQGIDTSFLVATLTKAIQELSAKNDALEARIATLEAK